MQTRYGYVDYYGQSYINGICILDKYIQCVQKKVQDNLHKEKFYNTKLVAAAIGCLGLLDSRFL